MTPQPSSPVRQTALLSGLRVWAEIDLDAIAGNVRALRSLVGASRFLAVIKGNAYGHGSVPVAQASLDAGAWGLGVVDVSEAQVLRSAGIEAPILILGATSEATASQIVARDLRATIGSLQMALALAAAARAVDGVARVHLKVETGLNRFGLGPEEVVLLANQIREMPGLEVEGISTHLASVDEGDRDFTMRQYAAFRYCADQLPWIPIRHIANTGAVLELPELHLDLVRCGIGIYGYYPADSMKEVVSLRPALSLRSRVARIVEVEAGDSVGYGRAWIARRNSKIALVMAGYADGISRDLSGKGSALVAGQPAARIGRVAMDMHMLDITDILEARLDDEVTLIGGQSQAFVDADELGRAAGTISYEILAGIAARVPRLFHRSGELCAIQDSKGYHLSSAL